MASRFLLPWLALACAALLIAQALSVTSRDRVRRERTEARIEVLLTDAADSFSGFLGSDGSLGPPEDVDAALQRLGALAPDILDVGLVLPDGHVVGDLRGHTALPEPLLRRLFAAAADKLPAMRPSLAAGVAVESVSGAHFMGVLLRDRSGAPRAALVAEVANSPGAAGAVRSGDRLIVSWAAALLAFALLVFAAIRRGQSIAVSRHAFVAVPIMALAAVEIVSCVEGASRLRHEEVRSARATLRVLAEPLLDTQSPDGGAARGESAPLELRLTRIAQSLPAISDIFIVARDERSVEVVMRHGAALAPPRKLGARPRAEKFDLRTALAPADGRTDLGFRQLLVLFDRNRLLSETTEFLFQNIAVGAAALLLLAETLLFIRPSAAQGRRAAAVDGMSHPSAAARRGRASVAGLACAVALSWPCFWQMSREATGLADAARDLAPLSALAIEAAAAGVSAVIGAVLEDRHGWRVPALLGLVLGAVGMAMAALAVRPAFALGAWAFVGAGEGMASLALLSLASGRPAREEAARNAGWFFGGVLSGYLAGILMGGVLAAELGLAGVLVASGLVWLGTCAGVVSVENDANAPLRRLVAAPAGGARTIADFDRLLRQRHVIAQLLAIAAPIAIAEILMLRLADQVVGTLAGALGAMPELAAFAVAALLGFHVLPVLRKAGAARRLDFASGVLLVLASPALFRVGDGSARWLALALGGLGLSILLHRLLALARAASAHRAEPLVVLRACFVAIKAIGAMTLLALAAAVVAGGTRELLGVGYGAGLAGAALLALLATWRRRHGRALMPEPEPDIFARP
jgi:hypothetical protein